MSLEVSIGKYNINSAYKYFFRVKNHLKASKEINQINIINANNVLELIPICIIKRECTYIRKRSTWWNGYHLFYL